LELTEKGKELLKAIHSSQGLNEVLSVLSEKEREQMFSLDENINKVE
jgi:DNA-binding MarR family transcriptional regulator